MSIINAVVAAQPVNTLSISPVSGSSGSSSDFAAHLEAAVNRVESAGAEADRLANKFISGEQVDLHNVALSGQKASLEFEMFLQVRNKIVQAYQEVMRIQL